MLKAELLELIANGENSGVEFKRDDLRPEQLAKEIVVLSNFQGGRILLGVDDDGSIAGIHRERLEEWVMNSIQNKVHPQMLPFYEEIRVDEGHTVAVITVPQGIAKPYVVRESSAKKIYVRVGSTSQLATREQQMRLFELGGMFDAETLPVSGTGMDCLDRARLQNYLDDIFRDPDVPNTILEWEASLLARNFLTKANDRLCCTVAGLVLFGKTPRRYLKQSGLRIFAFSGEHKDYQALLDTVLDGPLVGRWDVTSSGKTLIDGGLIERCIEAITPFISREPSAPDKNFRRESQWLVPFDAIREVVVNALAHRDWTLSVDIEIGVYTDRLEVISPGALQNSMTVEKMIAGQRSLRNRVVVDVLRDYGYIEHRGMGIRTKVIPLMKRLNQTDPIFEATEDYLKITLPAAQSVIQDQ